MSGVERRSRKRKKDDYFFPSVSAKKFVEELNQILTNVLMKNRSEYVILCGPSGCGKSVIIDRALQNHRDGHAWSAFHYVALDGKLHGSPRASVDEILRQTGFTKTKSDGSASGTIAEKLEEMCRFLTEGATDGNNKKVGYLFVIEQVEGLIEQNNQMLLYNLFDMAYSQNIPTCILATSTVVDVMEKMEKRVKSRFSQRVINVAMDLFADVEEYKAAIAFSASQSLKLDLQSVERSLDDRNLGDYLRSLHESKRDWNTVNRLVCLAYAHTTPVQPALESAHFLSACEMLLADATVSVMKDLPYLQLALVLSCFEYAAAQEETTFNYSMIEEVYITATKQKLKSFRYGRHLIAAAFQDLEDYGLLKPVVRVKNEPVQFKLLSLNIAKHQLREALRQLDLNTIPTDLRSWCKDFV